MNFKPIHSMDHGLGSAYLEVQRVDASLEVVQPEQKVIPMNSLPHEYDLPLERNSRRCKLCGPRTKKLWIAFVAGLVILLTGLAFALLVGLRKSLGEANGKSDVPTRTATPTSAGPETISILLTKTSDHTSSPTPAAAPSGSSPAVTPSIPALSCPAKNGVIYTPPKSKQSSTAKTYTLDSRTLRFKIGCNANFGTNVKGIVLKELFWVLSVNLTNCMDECSQHSSVRLPGPAQKFASLCTGVSLVEEGVQAGRCYLKTGMTENSVYVTENPRADSAILQW